MFHLLDRHGGVGDGGLAAVLVLGGLVGCGGPSRVEPASLEPEESAQQAIKRYDKDGDRRLSSSELSPALRSMLATADANGDKALSQEEIAARLRKYEELQVAFQTVSGPVYWNGKPLIGAKVTLVPDEVFANLKRATGVTDDRGYVDLQTEGSELPGVQPGVYRVEVSKPDGGKELIPAKYNVSTELGVEIGVETAEQGGVASDVFRLNLKGMSR